ncbi:GNAT family N-acetyltransferase [Fodinicola feengrottensis]|uniref:GNAT family N-acetyltransferase n=1 Tax=Fodinicola feengrottensis TaxID=435914 RepID=A0ABN2FZW2_9ACTN
MLRIYSDDGPLPSGNNGEMTVDVKFLSEPAELERAGQVFRTSLVGVRSMPEGTDTVSLTEPGRMIGAVVDGEIVGTVNSYSARLRVPGGELVPHAAVTHVGMLPTHTRRGIITKLMRRQLADFAARGEIIATLRASEAVIYERFGYGVATTAASYEVTCAQARFRDGVPAGGQIRLLDPTTSRPFEEAFCAAAGLSWTGAIERYPYWWRHQQAWPQPLSYVAVHGPAGAEDGYVRYRPLDVDNWFDGPKILFVGDLVATTDQAWAGLLRHVLSVDLVKQVNFNYQPIDSPLPAMMVDTRAVRTAAIDDETWLRLVDVQAALVRRTYAGDGVVTVAVTDAILPENSGTYEISAKGAVRTDAVADLSLDVATLGALYLSGPRWRQLQVAGRVVEHREGAIAAADDLFRTDRPPFCGTYF